MKFLRLLIVSLCVGVLLTSVCFYCSLTAFAQDKQQTTQTDKAKTDTTTVGFLTGTKCTKTGTYRAGNKYLEIILVVAEGEAFPPFADGEKTTWYALTPSTQSTFVAVKVPAD